MTIGEKLAQFGLEGKKAKIYLALLELGTARVFEIAKKSGVERPTAYDILNKLVREGLASFFDKDSVLHYRAEDPEKILDHLQEKQRVFERMLPELKSVYNALAGKPQVHFYEGIGGIKAVLEDTLTSRDKKLCGVLSVVDLFEVLGQEYMETYVQRRVEERINLRVVRSKPKEVDKEYWPTSLQALRQLRYAPAQMVFSMTTYTYGAKVALISSRRENFGMIIESGEFYENMQHLFEALWQVSKPDK